MIMLDSDLRDKLIVLARKLADERGWTWREPVEVTSGVDRGEPVWVIHTNALMLSPSVRIVLRQSDLAVIRVGYLPR